MFVWFSALSMFSAGAVEVYRVLGKDGCDESDGECRFEYVYQGILYEASEMSILWQAPQFVFAALAEIFVHITALQLAYLEAPTTEHCKVFSGFFDKKNSKKIKSLSFCSFTRKILKVTFYFSNFQFLIFLQLMFSIAKICMFLRSVVYKKCCKLQIIERH